MAVTAPAPRAQDFGVLRRVWDWLATTLRLLARNRVGFAGFLLVVAILLMAFVGPLFVPLDEQARVDQIYQPPSAANWLGTDSEGRDVLRQIINGGRAILIVGFLAATMSTIIALILGSLSAYAGGRTDAFLTWLADAVLTIPQIPLLAVLAGILQFKSQAALAAIIGVLAWPTLMRAIRAQVLSLKERDYVESARALDLGTSHILFREIAPNMVGYIAINFTLALTAAMYASVGLIFLGLVPLSENNWGVMINLAWTRGAIFFKDSILYIMAPIVVISLFQLGLVGLTRSLAEVFDPRLRRG